MTLTRTSFTQVASHLEKRRMRLVICLGLYGSGLGASSLLVSFMTRTRYPIEPEHLEFVPSVLLSSGGWITGAIIAALIGYWIAPTSARPHSIILWLFIGFAFGVLVPFFSGALMPLGILYLDLTLGITSLSDLPMLTLDGLMRAPVSAISQGVLGLFTGLIAGTLFGFGAWVMDIANTSSHPRVSMYAPYVLSLGLSFGVVAIAAFGPAGTLAKLG